MASFIDRTLERLVQGKETKVDALAAPSEEQQILATLNASELDSREELERRAVRLEALLGDEEDLSQDPALAELAKLTQLRSDGAITDSEMRLIEARLDLT
jgi:hypothetical protein